MKKDNSYRSILKGTSLFGGVQVLQILINLVRGKFVAMFLGPEGMGIASLFTTSSNTIQRFASLGLNLAIVKEVAADSDDAGEVADPRLRFRAVMATAMQLIRATAILGAVICVLFSPWLSRITFGDDSMTYQFIGVGIAVGLTISFTGKLSVLQGLHEVKRLSKASLVGGLTGLFCGVPLYYLFGNRGIVPAMVILALAMYIFYSYSLRKSLEEPVPKFVWREHKPLVRKLIMLGLLLMTNDLLGTLGQYLLNIFIKNHGSTDAVGFYSAANSVTNQYAGLVFTAMAMDYFPRLSQVASDNREMRELVNRQTEIVSLIIAPAVGLLIITAPVLIRLLLTTEYLVITPLMRWMGLGILFRALMVPMGYISFAKGNRKLFFWMEGVTCNLLTLTLSCGFYYFFGLIGLGYALVADNLLCILIYYIVNRRLYGYGFSTRSFRHMAVAVMAGGGVFAASLLPTPWHSYTAMTLILLLTLLWSLRSLRHVLRK
jgi:O-antigen/teichoic acid export membrane protein